MGNLYEYTETMKYVRDMVFLEVLDDTEKSKTWVKGLDKFPKNKSFIDDKAWGDFGDDKPLLKKKSTKK